MEERDSDVIRIRKRASYDMFKRLDERIQKIFADNGDDTEVERRASVDAIRAELLKLIDTTLDNMHGYGTRSQASWARESLEQYLKDMVKT